MTRLTRLAVAALALVAITGLPAAASPAVAHRSEGTVAAQAYYYQWSSYWFELTGRISFGKSTFTGTAAGSYSVPLGATSVPPFALHGSSPEGDLDATCVDKVGLYMDLPTAGTLVCTGSIGGGPVSTTRLVVVLPVASGGSAPYHGNLYEYSGAFAG